MGVRKYVRDRKEVKAMRAQEDGYGAHAVMGEALGYSRTVSTPNQTSISPYEGTAAWKSQTKDRGSRGEGRWSDVAQPHVRTIPAGSQPATPRNPLKGN